MRLTSIAGKVRLKVVQYSRCISVFLIKIGLRPIILLDSDISELDWLEISYDELYFQGVKRLSPVVAFRTVLKKNVTEKYDNYYFDKFSVYRGVDLFYAAEYSICVSLEISRYELDLNNPIHFLEACKWISCGVYITDDLYKLFKKYNPSAVVIMQVYFVEACIASQLSNFFGYQLFALENTFYFKKIICEPITAISVNKTSVMSYYYRLQHINPSRKYLPAGHWIDTNIKHKNHESPPETYMWPNNKKRILFLGQCLTDSSLLFNVDKGYSTIEVLTELIKYTSQRDVHLFIKLHPKEDNGKTPLHTQYNRLTYRKLVSYFGDNLLNGNIEIDYCNEYSTFDLIGKSDVVVTINSQSGLEGLALGKEVILLNQAFYDQIGCTWNVSHISIFQSCLDAVLFEGKCLVNKKIIDAFLDIYFNNYCIDKDAKKLMKALKTRYISNAFV